MAVIDALVAFVLTYLARFACAAFSSAGSTVILNDIYYYIPPDVITMLPMTEGLSAALSSGGFIPLTAISTSVPGLGASDLSALVSNFSTIDDVFQNGFLEGTKFFFLLVIQLLSTLLLSIFHSLETLPRRVTAIKPDFLFLLEPVNPIK
jgi:hypothetical protein